MRTKKTKSTARFGPRYGSVVKERVRAIESKQRKKQKCPFCKKQTVKRLSKGIWLCRSCKKKFTSQTYYIKS
ncbi:MAG: 50S ribosomal protein L37ae [Candidatus Pacearchaeota archaeon]|nr:MAG: 50S ribosomal protein L37ae [Candidatus Pacearchaeota archaeon]